MISPIAQNLIDILRRHALQQSDRPVATNQPLGATGLGLDSLALLQFITALENQYEIELPETIWTEKGELTIERFESLILKAKPELARATVEEQIAQSADSPHSPHHHHRDHRFYDEPKASIASRIIRRIRHEEHFHILRCDLMKSDHIRHTAMIPVEIRQASPDDILLSANLFHEEVRFQKMAIYRERVEKSVTAFVAFAGNSIVGIDWLSGTGDYEPFLGLHVIMSDGSCFGFDLNEHPAYRGKGIGMALLSHSIEHAKQLGYSRQFTIVHHKNTKMLGAAVQIFDFEVAGEIVTTRWFGKVRSRWSMGGREGRGTIEL